MLSDLAYKVVKTYNDFTVCRARYLSHDILIIQENSFVNISSLCRQHGTSFKTIYDSGVLDVHFDNLSLCTNSPRNNLVITIEDDQIGGHFIHQDMLVHVMSLISPKFGTQLNAIFNNFLVNEDLVKKKLNKIIKKQNKQINILRRQDKKLSELNYKSEYVETKLLEIKNMCDDNLFLLNNR